MSKCSFVANFNNVVGFEVFTAVTVKNADFWDVVPCRSCVNRRFGGMYRLHLQGRKIRERGTSVSRWLQTESPPTATISRVSDSLTIPHSWQIRSLGFLDNRNNSSQALVTVLFFGVRGTQARS
jgi:hypothetical protein